MQFCVHGIILGDLFIFRHEPAPSPQLAPVCRRASSDRGTSRWQAARPARARGQCSATAAARVSAPLTASRPARRARGSRRVSTPPDDAKAVLRLPLLPLLSLHNAEK